MLLVTWVSSTLRNSLCLCLIGNAHTIVRSIRSNALHAACSVYLPAEGLLPDNELFNEVERVEKCCVTTEPTINHPPISDVAGQCMDA